MSSFELNNKVSPLGEVPQVVEHLFRHESGKLVATLTRIFGVEHLCLAQDVVQEALAKALQTWPFYGIPANPPAWMMRVSRNLALDVVRRQKVFRDKEAEMLLTIEQSAASPEASISFEDELADDRLRMMFMCCHPLISTEAQVALALNTLCGFSVGEISRAFLTTEAAIAKRLTRAKQRIRECRIPYEIPVGAELTRRLDGVLKSLYLLFNEGYKASIGEKLVREEICHEAIRLTSLLAEHPAGNQSQTHALLALMLLNSARNPTRMDAEGNLLLLKEQDRNLWDRSMIATGMLYIARSAEGEELSEYHLQAGISACHCAAKDYESTDWRQILALYDCLGELNDSPVIALNRAVAIANLEGPTAGLEVLASIQRQGTLDSYYLLYAMLGELEAQSDDPLAAAGYFRKSLQLVETESERAFLAKRFRACEAQIPPDFRR